MKGKEARSSKSEEKYMYARSRQAVPSLPSLSNVLHHCKLDYARLGTSHVQHSIMVLGFGEQI